jgi:broad specificity phosphatase PhoE
LIKGFSSVRAFPAKSCRSAKKAVMGMLIAVRHGCTAWNLERRFQGHTDIPLNDEGRTQARLSATLLRDERIDYAVCSDLLRARETGEILLAGRDTALVSDPGWREMHFGSWEGLTWQEITALYPQRIATEETQCERYMPEGGEAFAALCARVEAALKRLPVLPPEGCALLVTHAGPLHALLRVLGIMNEEKSLAVRFLPAEIVRFTRLAGKWVMSSP